MNSLLEQAGQIARQAGNAILPIAAEVGEVVEKADGSPLTRADLASHNIIEAGLNDLRPSFPVLSEEGDLDDFQTGQWRTFWCVDPLDGTKEFVKGLDEYTVNIALVEDAVPVLGVIYVPANGVLYYAARGLGAWKVEPDAEPAPISAAKCECPHSAVVSRSHLSAETERFLAEMGVTEVIRHGSSIKICAVAEGRADIYPRHGPTCLWDTAAGVAIAIEAGCAVVDLAGKPLSFNPSAGLKHAGFIVYPKSLVLADYRNLRTTGRKGPSVETADRE